MLVLVLISDNAAGKGGIRPCRLDMFEDLARDIFPLAFTHKRRSTGRVAGQAHTRHALKICGYG